MENCGFLPETVPASRRRSLRFSAIRFLQKAIHREEIFECEKQS